MAVHSSVGLKRKLSAALAVGVCCAMIGLVRAGSSAKAPVRVLPGTQVLPHAVAENLNLKELWQIPIGLSKVDGDQVLGMWRVGPDLYVSTRHGYLISINAKAGTINWDAKPARDGRTISAPAVAGKDKVAIFAQGYALTMNTRTGEITKRGLLGAAPGTDPAIYNGRLLMGGVDGGFYGLSAKFPGIVRWAQLSAKDSFTSDPVLGIDGSVTFASHLGYIWNKDATSGAGNWKRTVLGGVVAPLTSVGKLAFVPSLDSNVYAFEITSGQCPWVEHLPGRLDQPAIPSGKQLLVVSSGIGLFSLNSQTGVEKWGPVKGIARILAIHQGQAYGITASGEIKLISLGTGQIDASGSIPMLHAFADNWAGSTVYVATTDGRVAALVPDETP
ncbi:MAG: PQQ-binding-like beta-propeller repeat protein [Phycisphaerales bacterium]|nr:PQQ-binding-like beta-propeller repeat protein [Phycisphaerales bacterium]